MVGYVRRAIQLGLLLLIAAVTASAATVLTGWVYLAGTQELSGRGYGRSLGFDLAAIDGSFALSGGCGDTSVESPGSIAGNLAIAGPTASLGRVWWRCGPFSVDLPGMPDRMGRSFSVLTFDAVPVVLPTLPQPALEFDAFVDFTLPPTPFTLSTHLFVDAHQADLNPDEVLIDTDVAGRGWAVMQGRLWCQNLTEPPIAYIHSTTFIFDASIPEPSTISLMLVAGIALFAVRKVPFA
jgi:hypothetical protein